MLVLGVRINDAIILSNDHVIITTSFSKNFIHLTVVKENTVSKNYDIPVQNEPILIAPEVYVKYLSLHSQTLAHIGLAAPRSINIVREKVLHRGDTHVAN